jgi:hypothetical protein
VRRIVVALWQTGPVYRSLPSFILVALIPSALLAQQTELEPNESSQTPNDWTYGQTMSGGECNPGLGTDYFRIVLPTDGVISFTVTSQGSGPDPGSLQFALFPKYGFYQQYHTLAGTPEPSTISFSHSCLSGDTMLVRVQGDGIGNNSCINYEMSFSVAPAVFGNDVGYNDDVSVAQSVALDAPTDGHLDFLYDYSADWYSVTTPTDGKLRIICSAEHADVNTDGTVQLYVSPSNTFFSSTLGASGSVEVDTFEVTCLAAQTIPVRVQNGNGNVSCGISYQLRFEHVPNVFQNDPLPNDDVSNPQPVQLDVPFEGHTSNIGDQSSDFFGFTLPDEGALRVIMEVEHQGIATDGTLQMYEPESNSFHLSPVGANGTVAVDTFFVDCLHAGPDFIRVQNGNGNVACGISYRIALTLLPPAFGNDPEPNEGSADATIVAPDADQDGHISYLGTSSYDNYKLWKSFPGNMRVVFSSSTAGPSPALNVWTLNANVNENITTGENGEIAGDTVVVYTANPDTILMRVSSLSGSYCGSYRFHYESGPVGFSEGMVPETSIVVFPNPSMNAVFRITSPFPVSLIEVLDVEGRRVHVRRLSSGRDLSLDIADQPPGIYSVKLTSTDGRTESTRIVRAH